MKIQRNKITKSQIIILILSLLFSAFATCSYSSPVYADNGPSSVITPSEPLGVMKRSLKLQGKFTDDEIAQFSDSEIETVYQAMMGADKQTPSGDETNSAASTVVKAIAKVWKILPSPVKKAIGKYTGLAGFLKVINHYTGTEEHIIYSACKHIGMNDWWANFVTKTITLFI